VAASGQAALELEQVWQRLGRVVQVPKTVGRGSQAT
jgi:hypothetical protein